MIEKQMAIQAPELSVAKWFNVDAPLSLEQLHGRPVFIHAFQMLCPGCVSHAIPQTQKVYEMFAKTDLAVIGLHTVFEHHDAMTPVSLEAFIHEYRLTFPIGVDTSGTGHLPVSMERYGMCGTPTTVLIDRDGILVSHKFGRIDDLSLGVMIASLLARQTTPAGTDTGSPQTDNAVDAVECGPDACPAT